MFSFRKKNSILFFFVDNDDDVEQSLRRLRFVSVTQPTLQHCVNNAYLINFVLIICIDCSAEAVFHFAVFSSYVFIPYSRCADEVTTRPADEKTC